MSNRDPTRDTVERLAESFLARFRRGEHPSLAEYIERHPEHADDIRELFPLLVEMERAKSGPAAAPEAAPAPTPAEAPLQRLGDYRILRAVGEGGMGIVYEALREQLGSHVALKVLHPRFRDEARAAARLHHTNIVSVFDFGIQDGVCYYAMQFIAGQGLDKVLDDVRRLRAARDPASAAATATDRLTRTVARGLVTGQFDDPPPTADVAQAQTAAMAAEADRTATAATAPPRPSPEPVPPEPGSASGSLLGPAEARYFGEVARLGAQVADALAYAHTHGVLHRDIKPSNLLLDALGTVWVTDFGLAKFDDGEDLTESRDVVGTLRYMAPERFDGWSDRRSDVYALGATLYELLALRPAFEARNHLALIEQILRQPPTPLRRLDPNIPRDLETIVHKAMAKEPAERYPTAAELADDLRRFREHRTIRARRSTPAERFARWCRRNPALAATLAIIALLLVASTVLANLSAGQARQLARQKDAQVRHTKQAAIQLQAERDKAVTHLARAEAAERDAQAKLFDALKAEARARRFSRRVGQRFGSLDALRRAAQIGHELGLPAGRLAELRDEAIACMALPDLERVRTFDVEGTLALAPDHDRYALANPDGSISVRRLADGAELVRVPGESGNKSFWFSPDGQYLSVNYASSRKVWRLGGRPSVVNERDTSWSDAVSFSSDTRRLVTWRSGDGTVVVLDLPTGQVARRWKFPSHLRRAILSPDGQRLALVLGDPGTSVQIRNTETGSLLIEFSIPTAWGLNWHPDGQSVATEGLDGRISFWDLATRSRTMTLEGQTGGVWFTFHPSGDLLASTGWDGKVRLWDLRTGRELLRLPGGAIGPLFSRDGRMLAARGPDGRPALWQIAADVEFRTLALGGYGGARHPAVHPAGRLVAGADGHAGITLWDMAGSRPLAFLPIPDTGYVLFDASGDLLTSSPSGVLRWPVRADPGDADVIRIGPPRRIGLAAVGGDTELARSRDGRVVAVARYRGALVWHADRPDVPVALGPNSNDDVRRVAVSPDGRWVATEGHAESRIKAWDSRSGTLVKDLIPREPVAWRGVHFSPDGRWLATKIANGRSRLWRLGTWTEGPLIEGVVLGFSPDGRFLAAEAGNGTLRLIDPSTGHDLARLENPDQSRTAHAEFTPDGAQLLATGDSQSIRRWDLRAIRRQLDELGLGEGFPVAASATDPGAEPPPIRRVEVDLGDRSPFASLEPSTPRGCNNVAWWLLTGPPAWHHPARALALAERAVAAEPTNSAYLNTLGLALYRAGRYARAVEALEANIATGDEFAGYDLAILAMTRHRLGQADRARAELDQARRWREARGDLDPTSEGEFRALLAEAEAVLREPPPELPDDLFAAPDPADDPRRAAPRGGRATGHRRRSLSVPGRRDATSGAPPTRRPRPGRRGGRDPSSRVGV